MKLSIDGLYGGHEGVLVFVRIRNETAAEIRIPFLNFEGDDHGIGWFFRIQTDTPRSPRYRVNGASMGYEMLSARYKPGLGPVTVVASGHAGLVAVVSYESIGSASKLHAEAQMTKLAPYDSTWTNVLTAPEVGIGYGPTFATGTRSLPSIPLDTDCVPMPDDSVFAATSPLSDGKHVRLADVERLCQPMLMQICSYEARQAAANLRAREARSRSKVEQLYVLALLRMLGDPDADAKLQASINSTDDVERRLAADTQKAADRLQAALVSKKRQR